MRDSVHALAVLGSPPAFAEPLHVGRPSVGDRSRFLERAEGILDRRWLTNDGPLVREFERRLAELSGVRHCVAMCNATIALEIAIRALELHGEVIVPSFTFVATAHALQWQEITPVFADIDPGTHNMDPARIEGLITPRTSGIIGVHLWGRPCDTEGIGALGRKHSLKVMYDAAHAIGCSHGKKPVGGFGLCEVFSFHATKVINSFEGGAVATNDDELAEKMRLMRNFGFSGYDNVIYPGTNGKMTEICAAMGLTSLEAFGDLTAINRRNYESYRAGLQRLSGISLIDYPEGERNNFHYVVIEIDPDASLLTRDEWMRVLHAENVLARRYFWPGCHQMEPYRSFFPNARLMLPETERVAARVLVLPTGQSLPTDAVARICTIMESAAARASEVRSALRSQTA